MDIFLYILALITAGVALVTGLNFVSIDINRYTDKTDLIFGIQALLLFLFLILPPTGFILTDQPPYSLGLDIKRFFIWLYYGSFPFFLEHYSGYRNKPLKLIIIIASLISYPVYLSTAADDIQPAWRLLVLFPLSLVAVLGLLSARYQIRNGNKSEGRWLQIAMYVYVILFVLIIPFFIAGPQMEKLLGLKQFFSFNLNPLAFILIMSIRLKKNTLNKYKTERLLRLQNNRSYFIMFTLVVNDKAGRRIYGIHGIKTLGA
jgi:hypothetical protein